MWSGFDPTPYTRDQYAAHVAALPKPEFVRFIALHNTGSPTLAQWIDGGVSEVQRLVNLEHYYEVTEHWHAGPHGFISPTHICGFSNPGKAGVHASCFNSISLGFEMVGDFSVEAFDSGPGAAVRDNAVFALAVWHRKLGLRPDGYRYGVSGLHFHKDCMRDHHDCPGPHVDRADMVARVLEEMQVLGGVSAAAVAPVAPPAPLPLSAYLRRGSRGPDVGALQARINQFGAGLKVDDDFGAATQAAVESFQAAHGLVRDGIVGPLTDGILSATLVSHG